MRNVLFLAVMLAFVFPSAVWASDISGTWTVKWQSPHGENETFDLHIKATGKNLTITGTHPKLEKLVGTGILKGNAILMNLKATGSMKVIVDMGGTVMGNKMSGTRVIMTAPGGNPGAASAEGKGAPGNAPGGIQGSAPGGQGRIGKAPAGGQGGAPGVGPGGESAQVSNVWTAEKKTAEKK